MDKIAIYARVSTGNQNTELQIAEMERYLGARGVAHFQTFSDVMTGTTKARPSLMALLAEIRIDRIKTVVVWKLDRLARSLRDLIGLLQLFESFGVELISIHDHIDMTSPSGKLLFHLIGAFAEFEAELCRERVLSGIANARRKGIRLGRPKIINDSDVVLLRRQGLSLSEIARRIGASKGAVSKTLKRMSRINPLNY